MRRLSPRLLWRRRRPESRRPPPIYWLGLFLELRRRETSRPAATNCGCQSDRCDINHLALDFARARARSASRASVSSILILNCRDLSGCLSLSCLSSAPPTRRATNKAASVNYTANMLVNGKYRLLDARHPGGSSAAAAFPQASCRAIIYKVYSATRRAPIGASRRRRRQDN